MTISEETELSEKDRILILFFESPFSYITHASVKFQISYDRKWYRVLISIL